MTEKTDIVSPSHRVEDVDAGEFVRLEFEDGAWLVTGVVQERGEDYEAQVAKLTPHSASYGAEVQFVWKGLCTVIPKSSLLSGEVDGHKYSVGQVSKWRVDTEYGERIKFG